LNRTPGKGIQREEGKQEFEIFPTVNANFNNTNLKTIFKTKSSLTIDNHEKM
jgi:hypothetical protein